MKTPKAPTPEQNPHSVAKAQVWKSRDSRDEGTVLTIRRVRFDRDKAEWVADAIHGAGKGSGRETEIQLDRFGDYVNITDEVDPPEVLESAAPAE